jgi:hypothetical protein
LIDVVVDRGDLCRNVRSRADNIEFLDLIFYAGHGCECLGVLDHLDAPGIADVAVHQRYAIGTRPLRPLKEL